MTSLAQETTAHLRVVRNETRAELFPRRYKIDAAVVAEHQCSGLERYLTHLAELWARPLNLPIAA